jgi:hypothetical protein
MENNRASINKVSITAMGSALLAYSFDSIPILAKPELTTDYEKSSTDLNKTISFSSS